MTDQRERAPFHARTAYRLLAGGFGLFLAGVGCYALFFAPTSSSLRFVAGPALVLFGGNMVLSACRARESWLSRIGPLP